MQKMVESTEMEETFWTQAFVYICLFVYFLHISALVGLYKQPPSPVDY